MKLLKTTFLVITAFAMWTTGARAANLWSNTIDDTNPSTANPFTAGQVVDTNITVSGIGRGSGATANSGGNRYNAASFNTTTLDPTAYFTFTLDANTGYEIDFTSFTYSGQASSSFTSPLLALRSSVDNFASNIGSATTGGTTISLTAASFQNLTTPIEFRLYVWNAPSATATYSVNDFSFAGTVSTVAAAGNNSTITAPSGTSFGRVMQGSTSSINVSLGKTGADATTYSATANNNGVTVTADGNIAANSQTEVIGVALANNANGSSVTGTKSYTVTVDNTATTSAATNQGSADANDAISVTGTVVGNRTISASSVDLGKVLVGVATGTQSSTLTTSGDDNNNTRVTVSGSQASNNGVTVAAGTSQLFDGASDTTTRNVTGNFSTSGNKSVDVSLSRTGEGLTGESVNAVTVHATAAVYQAASLATNNSAPLATGDTITVSNANTTDGGQRAAAKIVGKTVTGDGWTVSGLDESTVIAQNTTASATASFNEGGKLNGTHTGTLLLNFQHNDQTIRGTSTNDLGSRSWSFSHVISGVTASSGEATVESGKGYAGFGLKNDAGKGTEVGLLAGISSGESTISMSFDSTAPGFGVAGNDADRVSDIVNLTGSGSDLIVLQLTYDETAIGAAGYSSEEELRLGYLSGGKWVMAGSANTGSNANVAQLGFLGSFAAFQNIYGTNLSNYIGAFGVDTAGNTAWAVINHNSEFAVVPEPGTYALLALGGMMVLVFRRRLSSRRS